MTFCCFVKDPALRYNLRKGSFRKAWDDFIPSLADKVQGDPEYKEDCGRCERREDCRWCPPMAISNTGDTRRKSRTSAPLRMKHGLTRKTGSVITAGISGLRASRSRWIPISRSRKRPLIQNSRNSKRPVRRKKRFRCAIIFLYRNSIGTIWVKRFTAERPGRSTARTGPGSTWA